MWCSIYIIPCSVDTSNHNNNIGGYITILVLLSNLPHPQAEASDKHHNSGRAIDDWSEDGNCSTATPLVPNLSLLSPLLGCYHTTLCVHVFGRERDRQVKVRLIAK